MICLVMLSVGTAFAADDGADVIAADEIAVEGGELAVGQDTQINVADSNVVTPDTFSNYFDKDGRLLENVTSDELVFEGTFESQSFIDLTVDRPINLTGNNVTFNGISLLIVSDNVTVSNFKIIQNRSLDAIFISGSDVTIQDTTVDYTDAHVHEAVAIYAINSSNLRLLNNVINYVGGTDGSTIDNAILITQSNGAIIRGNKFNLSLVSCYVPWFEIPSGSGKWVSFPVSEGIVVNASEGVQFEDNTVDVTYNNVVGGYDTIYAVDFKNSDYAMISNNTINASGHYYIYGIVISGENFNINNNTIDVESDIYYANGIDIEGPASGVVDNNDISVKGVVSAYPIYSGMNGANVTGFYIDNTIAGEAYNVFGFSLGDVQSDIINNSINLIGNYTTGIAYKGSNLNADGNIIGLVSSEVGNESVWEDFGVESVGIKVIDGDANIVNNYIIAQGKGVYLVSNGTVNLDNNTIDVTDKDGVDSYGVFVEDSSDLKITKNNITYVGNTAGAGINNGLYVNNVLGASITDNNFNLSLVSCYVPWFEIPAGSGNWVGFPVSEGIVLEESESSSFERNVVDVTYNNVVGGYDTIYAVDFKNSDYAMISNNTINALGHYYIYGIILSGQNFNINNNTIDVESDIYYANGIDIEGPASGVVDNNVISVKGVVSAYPIYSGMNGANVTGFYIDNNITGEAYNVFGFSLGDVQSDIINNSINLVGNYTTGIAYRGSNLNVTGNNISALGSNVGDMYVWEAFGVENIGVKVTQGTSTITDNNIETSGYVPINLNGNKASVHDNYLVGTRYIGDEGVKNSDNAEVYNNTPAVGDKSPSSVSITEVDGDCNITGIVKDANGNPIKDAEVQYSLDGTVKGIVTTDANGVFKASGLSNGEIQFTYSGDSFTANSTATITLVDVQKERIETTIKSSDYETYSIDFKAGERGNYFKIQLLDVNGKALANKAVKIGFNGVVYDRITDSEGKAQLQINLKNAGVYTFAVAFLGDDDYKGSFVVNKITVNKKTTKISAPAKTFKASAKTKSYTVTLSTIKGSSIDGKTYMEAGKQIKLTINGKTYTANTNSKGQATFKLSITKKGSYSGTVSFAGDNAYEASKATAKIKIN